MAAAGESYAATALRADVRQQLALPRWSIMADATKAGAEGLLVREDYRSPIIGSTDPERVDLTWPAFLEKESNPGGEGLLPVVAQLLGRPILLINANTAQDAQPVACRDARCHQVAGRESHRERNHVV